MFGRSNHWKSNNNQCLSQILSLNQDINQDKKHNNKTILFLLCLLGISEGEDEIGVCIGSRDDGLEYKGHLN